MSAAKYRWLTEGHSYRYSAALGKGRDELRGQMCTVVTVPRAGSRPANVLIEFAGGERHVVPNGVLKPLAQAARVGEGETL